MKIYIAHSSGFDFKNEIYKPIRESKLNTEHEFILPHEKNDKQYSSKELFQSKSVDIIIAEVSFPSTGLGIELGLADMSGIKSVGIYKSGSNLSGSVRSFFKELLEYNKGDLVKNLEELLRS